MALKANFGEGFFDDPGRVARALPKLTAADEARIGALLKKAAS